MATRIYIFMSQRLNCNFEKFATSTENNQIVESSGVVALNTHAKKNQKVRIITPQQCLTALDGISSLNSMSLLRDILFRKCHRKTVKLLISLFVDFVKRMFLVSLSMYMKQFAVKLLKNAAIPNFVESFSKRQVE